MQMKINKYFSIKGKLFFSVIILSLVYTGICAQVPQILIQPHMQQKCPQDSALFTISAIGTKPLSYQWQKNGIHLTGANDTFFKVFSVTAGDTGMYSCIVSNSLGNTNSNEVALIMHPAPNAFFTVNKENQCKVGNFYIFTNTSSISSGTLTYYWDFDDGSSSTQASPTKIFLSSQKLTVSLEVTSDKACKDMYSKDIEIYPMPMTSYQINDKKQCLPYNRFVTNNFSSISYGTISYYWDMGDGTTNTNTNIIHTYGDTGWYDIKLITTSNNACKDSVTTPVYVYDKPPVYIGEDRDLKDSDSMVLNAGPGYASYFWNDSSTKQTLTIYGWLLSLGPHTFSVSVEDKSGCKNSKSVVITVVEASGTGRNDRDRYIHIFPNPATEMLYIRWEDFPGELLSLRFLDLYGRVLKTYEKAIHAERELKVPCKTWEPGMYIIEFMTRNMKYCRKVLVY
jgi:PKD repeat protein